MPLIEELPVTSHIRPSHGWAYVPDINKPIAAVQPGNRKRARDAAGAPSAATISAKQQKAIEQRLKELDRENYKDVAQIPIPKRDENRKGRKITTNARRILGYNRTFQHYLADEEAAIAAGGGGPAAVSVGTGPGAGNVAGAAGTGQKVDGRRKNAVVRDGTAALSRRASGQVQQTPTKSGTMQPPAKPASIAKREKSGAGACSTPQPLSTGKSKEKDKDVEMTGTDPSTSTSTPSSPTRTRTKTTSSPTSATKPSVPVTEEKETDPLLITLNLPKMPSERVMAALVAEPALSYNAARAKPLHTSDGDADDGGKRTGPIGPVPPPRYFCSLCGYWGKIKCRRCGERVCGLMECWKGHEGVCSAGVY